MYTRPYASIPCKKDRNRGYCTRNPLGSGRRTRFSHSLRSSAAQRSPHGRHHPHAVRPLLGGLRGRRAGVRLCVQTWCGRSHPAAQPGRAREGCAMTTTPPTDPDRDWTDALEDLATVLSAFSGLSLLMRSQDDDLGPYDLAKV